jgi:hypothetical protein
MPNIFPATFSAQTNPPSPHPVLTSDEDITLLETVTVAAPPTERLVRGEFTLTPATAIAIPNNGSLAGTRGAITLSPGKSITAGFLYGAQGKVVLDGATVDVGSAHIAGVYGQMSAAGATLNSGHIAPLMAIGQSLPAGIANMIYAENNSPAVLNAILQAVANANYALDITSEDGNSAYLAGAAGAAANKWLRVRVSGVEYKIALLAAS